MCDAGKSRGDLQKELGFQKEEGGERVRSDSVTEETRVERDTCTLMFITALFTIAGTWKQPRCPLADEWIRKLWYIYTMEYHSASDSKGTHLSQF